MISFGKITLFALFLTLSFPFFSSHAQQLPVSEANYRMAERFSPTKVNRMVFSTHVRPSWLKTGEKFWYSYNTPEGTSWYLVDLEKQSKLPLFDNHEMARQLTLITKDPYDYQNLPRIQPEFVKDDKYFRFSVSGTRMADKEDETEETIEEDKDEEEKDEEKDNHSDAPPASKEEKTVFRLEYEIATGRLYEIEEEEKPKAKPWANVSPDSTYVVFARDFNLFWMDKENYLKALEDENDSTIVEHQLTTDGVPYYEYGPGYIPQVNEDEKKIEKEKNKRQRAGLFWSPDSRKFALIRNDTREIKYLWVINSLDAPRPTLNSYKYQLPGEKDPAESELWVFDLEKETADTVPVAAFKNQTLQLPTMSRTIKESLEDHTPFIWLSPSSDELYFMRLSRDLKRLDHCKADLQTMEVKVLIEERMNTYVDTRPLYLMKNNKDIIHWSERDGWGHFYLYDTDGNLKHQITSGPWYTERLIRVDEKNQTLFFTAKGRETGENPYYTHLYSINLDGSDLRLLNPGNYDHSAFIGDSFRYIINNYSRVDTTPVTEIRNARGERVMELETTDMSLLFESGYTFPEPYQVKAADGVTDLYGVMYKPFDFDPGKKYPLIMYVYPGPQTEHVNTSFSSRMDQLERLAQIGFVVVTMGNRGGSPSRSKWYQNYGYGDLRDYGLADKKYGAEQLADRFDFIDIEKVGIFGHSGGGFMSTAAMLQYPDFFKVAVSSAGNHDNTIYNRWWSERHHGLKEIVNNEGEVKFLFEIETNPELAENLKGKLLLTTGDIDNNVHPGSTLRMADALMKAHKRFDLFVFPGQGHGYGQYNEYNFWLTADYFSKHLIGDESISTDIFEMRREHKLSPSEKRQR